MQKIYIIGIAILVVIILFFVKGSSPNPSPGPSPTPSPSPSPSPSSKSLFAMVQSGNVMYSPTLTSSLTQSMGVDNVIQLSQKSNVLALCGNNTIGISKNLESWVKRILLPSSSLYVITSFAVGSNGGVFYLFSYGASDSYITRTPSEFDTNQTTLFTGLNKGILYIFQQSGKDIIVHLSYTGVTSFSTINITVDYSGISNYIMKNPTLTGSSMEYIIDSNPPVSIPFPGSNIVIPFSGLQISFVAHWNTPFSRISISNSVVNPSTAISINTDGKTLLLS